MNCKKCGKELDKKAVVCPGCGCKVAKPVYKKVWFWILIAIVIIVAASASGGEEGTSENEKRVEVSTSVETNNTVVEEKIEYEVVNLQTLYDELEANALKAEKNYNKKHIEFACKIASFDSDGNYIAVEPVNASDWNFITSNCYIKNDTQLDFLLEKNVDDVITIKGKVKSIGEILGYSIDIDEVY